MGDFTREYELRHARLFPSITLSLPSLNFKIQFLHLVRVSTSVAQVYSTHITPGLTWLGFTAHARLLPLFHAHFLVSCNISQHANTVTVNEFCVSYLSNGNIKCWHNITHRRSAEMLWWGDAAPPCVCAAPCDEHQLITSISAVPRKQTPLQNFRCMQVTTRVANRRRRMPRMFTVLVRLAGARPCPLRPEMKRRPYGGVS